MAGRQSGFHLDWHKPVAIGRPLMRVQLLVLPHRHHPEPEQD